MPYDPFNREHFVKAKFGFMWKLFSLTTSKIGVWELTWKGTLL